MATTTDLIDSRAAWLRLVAALALSTIGGVGMWSVVVALPAIQAEFGVTRAAASFPYTLTMLGFGVGGIMMGRLSDRFGVRIPLIGATCALAIGYIAASMSSSLLMYAIVQGVLIGMLGSSASFGPLMADISHWFLRRRGLAVSIVASGNYLAGAVWPPIVQHLIETVGWRTAHFYIGVICSADDAAVDIRDAACTAACRRNEQCPGRFAGAEVARHLAVCIADVADDRRRGMLRGDVDAASAYRRLLRGSRLRPGGRSADVVDDARVWHCQSACIRVGSPITSAVCAHCCSAPCCKVWRCCFISHSTA